MSRTNHGKREASDIHVGSDAGTCFMAIELSKASWLIGIITSLSDKVSLPKIPCGDVRCLMEIVDRTIDHVSQATGRPAQIVSCYEAGYNAF